MLTYLYECPSCGEFEIEQSILADPLTSCPNKVGGIVCGGMHCTDTVCGQPVKRLIGGGAYIGGIPDYMSDRNISARQGHRDWLKTPEAKAMDLSPCKDG